MAVADPIVHYLLVISRYLNKSGTHTDETSDDVMGAIPDGGVFLS